MRPSQLSCIALLAGVVACQAEAPGQITPTPDDEAADYTITPHSGTCYCAEPYTCGHSTSTSYVYPTALTALRDVGITDGELLQTYGDAAASVGTHCPEPNGSHYSAATDIDPGASPCGRVHALRMHGFAAWYRVPPAFGYHIHAVFAGTPELKSSLHRQIDSFVEGRNGLVSNAYDTVCPITSAEIAAVENVRNGGSTTTRDCIVGGTYCGGDVVSGSSNTLYRCGANNSTTVVQACSQGCSVNAGRDDTCKCAPNGLYCGGDTVAGDANTLYKCGADGLSATEVHACTNGCSVNPGRDDSCN